MHGLYGLHSEGFIIHDGNNEQWTPHYNGWEKLSGLNNELIKKISNLNTNILYNLLDTSVCELVGRFIVEFSTTSGIIRYAYENCKCLIDGKTHQYPLDQLLIILESIDIKEPQNTTLYKLFKVINELRDKTVHYFYNLWDKEDTEKNLNFIEIISKGINYCNIFNNLYFSDQWLSYN
jgi:hypothetical protein